MSLITKTSFEIELPTQATEPELVNPTTMVLFGLAKSGKTTAVLGLEGCCDISLEKNGVKFGKGIKLQIPEGLDPIESIRWLRAVAAKIKADGRPYKYVAIDTLTIADMWCEWVGTERYMNSTAGKTWNRWNKADHPDKPTLWGQRMPYGHEDYESIHTQGQGYGYRWSRAEVISLYNELADLGSVCTIFVCHVSEKQTVKIGSTEEVVTRNISLTGLVKDIISRQVDAIGYLYNEDGETMISFAGNEAKIGGMRGATHLKGYVGKLDWKKIFI